MSDTATAHADDYRLRASVDATASVLADDMRLRGEVLTASASVTVQSVLVTENEYVILTENGYSIYFEGLSFAITPAALRGTVGDYRIRI